MGLGYDIAVLTNSQFAALRRAWVKAHRDADPTYGPGVQKADVNNMMQAIEDWLESNRSVLSAVIDTATSPVTFTNTEKKKAFAVWCDQKFGRDR